MKKILDEINFATAWEKVAEVVPESPALSYDGRRISWKDFEERAAGLANFLNSFGLSLNSKVALYCYNGPEYSEAQFATLKIRAIPANVNYRYLDNELAYILENADAEAIFFDHTLSERVEKARKQCSNLKVAIQVGGEEVADWAVSYKQAVRSSLMSPIKRSCEDLWFLYTGGTTGRPKAVMWTHRALLEGMKDSFNSLGEEVPTSLDEVRIITKRIATESRQMHQLPAAPLMHGTSGLPALFTHTHGGLVVTMTSKNFDAEEFWQTVEREKVTMVTLVGDAFARPMIEALDKAASEKQFPDLKSLRLILSSGVMFSTPLKERLLQHHRCTIVDTLGSSEGASMGKQVTSRSRKGEGTAKFVLGEETRVFTEDGRDVQPGSNERGRLALGSPIPEGYYKDPEKTEKTFPTIQGKRWSIPGDWAMVEEDGSITLLGRGSECINTGGEKVYPEEVEEALKLNTFIADCNVVGTDDEKWGQAVVAVLELNCPAPIDVEVLREDVRTRLAGYKIPKKFIFVEKILRSPNGKSDYKWARKVVEKSKKDI